MYNEGNFITNFLYKSFLKTSKRKSLVFVACLVIGSFLSKLKTVTKCFELNILYTKLKDKVYGQCYFRNIVCCNKNKNPSRTICETRAYSPQNSTKLHQKCFFRVFWKNCTKNFKKYPKKRMKWSSLFIKLHDYRVQLIFARRRSIIKSFCLR